MPDKNQQLWGQMVNLHGRFRTGLVWEFCDEEEKEDDKDDDDDDDHDDDHDDDDDDDAIIQRSATLRAQKMCQSESHVSWFWCLFSYV